jgi:hypothetical protein
LLQVATVVIPRIYRSTDDVHSSRRLLGERLDDILALQQGSYLPDEICLYWLHFSY